MLGKAYKNICASASTLRDSHFPRNNKPALVCEQPVNEWNFLWKALEKLDETRRHVSTQQPRSPDRQEIIYE
jgi:hypothetical protein